MHASYHQSSSMTSIHHTQAIHIKILNLCKCKQAHEYAHIKCKQPSSWACSPYFVLLLSKNVDPPQYCALLIYVMSMLALSSPLYLFFLTFHIFVQISPPLSSMTIKGPTPYEICAMWRSMNTTWRLYHENLLWIDAKSWTRVDDWILNFHFWWTLLIDWNWHHL